jgi:hypothetical protein
MRAIDPALKLVLWALAAGLAILLLSVAFAHPGTEPCPVPDAGDPTPEQQARCVNQTYTCTAYTPPGSSFAPDGGPPYVPLIMAGQRCPVGDAGFTIPVIPTVSPEVVVDPAFCTETIGPDGGAHLDPSSTPLGVDPLGVDAFGCACKIGPDCRLKAADGGTALAPWGETLPFQSSVGLQCVGKVCVEVAGISSWPEECPTRRPLFDGGFPLPDGGVFDGGLEDF